MLGKCSYIRPSRSRGYDVVGIMGDGEITTFTLPSARLSELGVSVGSDVDELVLLDLLAEDELYRAELCALRILSYGDNNWTGLHSKLTAKGISDGAACKICDKMVSLGYINEQEQLLRLILKESEVNLSGPRKIRAKLRSRGYSASDISKVMASLIADGRLDFERTRTALIEKKLTRGATEEEKMKLLFKNGY